MKTDASHCTPEKSDNTVFGSVPNASWKIGEKITSPFSGQVVSLDPQKLGVIDTYKLLIHCVVPRPIGFISSLSKAGIGNLAPFSFFNAVSSQPACVMFSVSRRRDGTKKDTLINIEETKEFVANTVSEWMTQPMHQCSAEYPYGIDELKKVGLTALPSTKVKPVRVKESPIQMECRLYQTMDVGGAHAGAATIVVGEILALHIAKEIYNEDGRIPVEKIKPIARLGGISYGRTSGVFDIPRPPVPPEG